MWGEKRGLNPRQPESQSGALLFASLTKCITKVMPPTDCSAITTATKAIDACCHHLEILFDHLLKSCFIIPYLVPLRLNYA